ncbi:uncharacterized protein LOC133789100 isoform X2 [Humulus lupulus]|uniref:uncharacterized protein LOC133789100 isoform X2 n=1 Tax=Humulus lupulus TaxID=3486 RepID=UPI002B40183A|nr:uncharacterized protein LOC133789100 isoform X2 [Humulus lupulus]
MRDAFSRTTKKRCWFLSSDNIKSFVCMDFRCPRRAIGEQEARNRWHSINKGRTVQCLLLIGRDALFSQSSPLSEHHHRPLSETSLPLSDSHLYCWATGKEQVRGSNTGTLFRSRSLCHSLCLAGGGTL